VVRVRFAPSPTGSLHLGNALTAVANRAFADERGGALLLRIDDTDAARNVAGGEKELLADLRWLRLRWDEGPVRQSERASRHREAAEALVAAGAAARAADGAIRLERERRPTLLRADRSPTYQLASAVDDVDLAITHVIRGKDHLPNAPLHAELARALGSEPPEYIHHGLILGAEGQKLSKRHGLASLAGLREAGIPPEAVRAYLDELGLPRGDVRLDPARLRRLALDTLAALPDEELAARAGAPVALAPVLRGARDLNEARLYAREVLEPERVALPPEAQPTLERFRELRGRANGALDAAKARELVRELKGVGGDLRALRLVLTGRERGPELWAIVAALPREETLRRIDAAL
jgi:glutamyl/glutaminyl-tRNA synthetase